VAVPALKPSKDYSLTTGWKRTSLTTVNSRQSGCLDPEEQESLFQCSVCIDSDATDALLVMLQIWTASYPKLFSRMSTFCHGL
jgi:hypothetical protein